MAWVNLYNLFEEDKNFYGILNGLLNEVVEVKATEFTKKYGNEGSVEMIEAYSGKQLKDIIKSEISFPEWFLNREGKLINGDVFKMEDKIAWETLIEIDVLSFLAKMTDEELSAIADCAFIEWKYDGDVDYESPINHPQWNSETNSWMRSWMRSKKRNKEAQKEFFENIKRAREAGNTTS